MGTVDEGRLRSWARRLGRLASEAGPEVVVAHVAAHVARAVGASRTIGRLRLLDHLGADRALEAATTPPLAPVAELLPSAYAAVLPAPTRRRRGHVDTPWWVARRIAGAALAGLDARAASVVDPAVGGGAFLLAAARLLAATGVPPKQAIARTAGTDIDPLALAVAEAALWLLAAEADVPATPRLAIADALDDDHPLLAPASATVVVGNPPFLNQLARTTARSREAAARLRERYGDATRAYADSANLFLLRALSVVRPGGRVGMILPESFLAARDAGPARTAVARSARLLWLWRSVDVVFGTSSARVVAMVLERDDDCCGGRHPVERALGRSFTPMAPVAVAREDLAAAPTWSALFADPGIPRLDLRSSGTLGDHCRATAGFRGEYYGLVPLVTEEAVGGEDFPMLVTCGLVDPARCWWGERPVRFAGRSWSRPRVDMGALHPTSPLRARLERLLVPKVLLATQTRVLEAAADEAGRFVPSTPVVTVLPAPGRLWHVGAALTSPVLTAVALRDHAGAALAPDALRVPARAVGALPAPVDAGAWDAGAAAFRAASTATGDAERTRALVECATAMCAAYGIGGAAARTLVAWWQERLPGTRPGRRRALPAAAPQVSSDSNRGGRFSRCEARPSTTSGPPNP